MFVPSVYFSFSNTVHAILFLDSILLHLLCDATMCSKTTTTCKLNLLIGEINDGSYI